MIVVFREDDSFEHPTADVLLHDSMMEAVRTTVQSLIEIMHFTYLTLLQKTRFHLLITSYVSVTNQMLSIHQVSLCKR